MVHCKHSRPTDLKELSLFHRDRRIAKFSWPSRFNAASSMQFERETTQTDFSVSVLIKGVFQYSRFATDILEHYRRQGITHVHIGLFPTGGELHDQCNKAFRNYTGFVSIGGMPEEAATFQCLRNKDGRKQSFMQSALYHAKSFDDMLLVVDMDEIMTTMSPTEHSMVDLLWNQNDHNSTCFYALRSNSGNLFNVGRGQCYILNGFRTEPMCEWRCCCL